MTAITYTVQGGDTLSSIANRFGKTVNGLAAINKISNVNNITVGQKLMIDAAPAPEHVRWRTVGESVMSPFTNKERKEVLIDPCECIKKFFEAAKTIEAKPIQNDVFGDKKAKAMRTVRGVRSFHADFKAYEYGKTAEAVYGDKPPAKWRIATETELKNYGITEKDDLKIKNDAGSASAFKAQVYVPVNERFCDPMPAVLVFKGTTMSEFQDWLNNVEQGGDFDSEYYDKAVRLGYKLMDATKPIVIVGHSLGGGLAAACAKTCGKDSWTFNSAGLHPNTLPRYKATPKRVKIEAYRHEGEVLTAVQEPSWAVEFAKVIVPPVAGFWIGGPLGAFTGTWLAYKLHQTPAALGNKHAIACVRDAWSAVDRHGMANTLTSFNRQLRNAEEDLRKQTGVQCGQSVVV